MISGSGMTVDLKTIASVVVTPPPNTYTYAPPTYIATPTPSTQGGDGSGNPSPAPTPNWYACGFNIMEALHSLGGVLLSVQCIDWVVAGALAIPGVDVVAIMAIICAGIVALTLAAAAAASAYLFKNAAQEAAANCT